MIWLIGGLGSVSLLGLWVPQRSVVPPGVYREWQMSSPMLVAFLESLGLTEIYASPFTLTIWGTFFLYLALVAWWRWPAVRDSIHPSSDNYADPESVNHYPHKTSLMLRGPSSQERITAALAQQGYTVCPAAQGFYAIKNRFAPAASLMFYLSIFLLLLGVVLTVYARFTGIVELAEGEVFKGEIAQYVSRSVPPKIGELPQSAFLVEQILPTIAGQIATDVAVTLQDDFGKHHTLRTNQPYVAADGTSFMYSDFGVAPLMVIYDPTGREVDGAYVKLKVLQGKQDHFSLAGYQFDVTFFPDHVVKEGKDSSISQEFHNPVFRIQVFRYNRQVANGLVRPGGVLPFDSHLLVMQEMPLWVTLSVVKGRGMPFLYAGFAIAIVALTFRLLCYRREVVGKLVSEAEGQRLFLAGRAEFFRVLAEKEFQLRLFPTLLAKLEEQEHEP
ncbi:cytochrome c biogenesis protein ResB [Geomobilimonas luticola]|uniref:Cytochrome c biogenesis protein ResB n=1 Tax=Geomobilimonas luticola TaxID=1114878 RepID=A0ABS5S9J0_9BACT|nr:cytochrome c biogenesis protein ResB [Geomobilimonas luticola]MBT0652045.1 cytochrome c biogenesis protein ResB [Geomobilimonas luticola]